MSAHTSACQAISCRKIAFLLLCSLPAEADALHGKRMKTRLTLKPGRRGTLKLKEEYGDALLYVRYRYDEQRKRRVKTVELVVEEVPWLPGTGRITRDMVFGIRVEADEHTVQQKVRQVGGIWNPKKKCGKWRINTLWNWGWKAGW